MSKSVANWIVLVTVIVLILCAAQSEPVTAVMGWTLAVVYMLALIAQTLKGK